MKRFLCPAIIVLGLCSSAKAADPIVPDGSIGFEAVVKPFLEKHCYDCHGDADGEGDVDLSALPLELKTPMQTNHWLEVLEQIQAGLMPPLEESRPDAAEKTLVTYWIEKSVIASGHADAYRQKLMLPAYGNLVDHDLLFSGKIESLPYTPARVWRRSPFIFDGSVNAVGKAKTQNPYTYSTPKTGVRDYARASLVGSSVVETVVLNANAEIDLMFDQLTGGAERDRSAAELRKREAEAFNQNVLDEAQKLLNERGQAADSPGKKRATSRPQP